MKHIIFFILAIFSLSVNAQYSKGNINKLSSGSYQIEYPNQLINVYFNFRPSGGFDNVTGLEQTEFEEYEIVSKIRNQTDKFPTGFIGKFLSVDVFPLHILTGTHFGYHYNNKIVIETSDHKLASTYEATIGSIFSHEVAHHFLNKMEYREETIRLKKHFEMLRQNDSYKKVDGFSVNFHTGYVSRQAYGFGEGNYEVEEEICELFSYLTAKRKHSDLIGYVNDYPNSLIAQKVYLLIEYLQVMDPEFTMAYLFGGYETRETLQASVETEIISTSFKDPMTTNFNHADETIIIDLVDISGLDDEEDIVLVPINSTSTYETAQQFTTATKAQVTKEATENKPKRGKVKKKSPKKKKRDVLRNTILGTLLVLAFTISFS